MIGAGAPRATGDGVGVAAEAVPTIGSAKRPMTKMCREVAAQTAASHLLTCALVVLRNL
jgi:hypothetical protein